MRHIRRHLALAAAVFAANVGVGAGEDGPCPPPQSTIVFATTRDNPTIPPSPNALEVYSMAPDGTNLRRLTANTAGEGLPALSPDGKGWIVFDSNRLRVAGEPVNTSDLFLMNRDGDQQTALTRGSSGAWSPDSRKIAFHASATGTGLPIKADPGAATEDSDLFVLDVKKLLRKLEKGADAEALDRARKEAVNITNTPEFIEDDPDWSPDGKKIAFTRHGVDDPHNDSVTAEIHVLSVKTGKLEQLTANEEEERGPAWSPDGTRIAYMCRRGAPTPQGLRTFEICLMDLQTLDATGLPVTTQLTRNSVFDGGPHWSPDGKKIVFGRMQAGGQQVWVMDLEDLDPSGLPVAQKLPEQPGTQLFANWGEIETECAEEDDEDE